MAEDGYYAFNDMHAMMAFVGDGRDHAVRRAAGGPEPAGIGDRQQRRDDARGRSAGLRRDPGLRRRFL